MKIFIIIALVGLLVYLIARRFMLTNTGSASIVRAGQRQHFVVIDTSPQLIRRVTKSTLRTVGIGLLLLLVALVLGMKIKILWILIPLSLYLIGQFFVYTNHIKYTKDQRIYFNPETYEVLVDYIKDQPLSFNLMRDIVSVSEIKSVQKNRDTLFGYYKLRLKKDTVVIPYLIEQNESAMNRQFFTYLNENFKIEVESKLFPII
ncbi:hypothetical protein FXV77_20950 [Sphingobacterium phlebotomi]|uniref:Uncharacterized protein n=1 Tax=Sphingobacterium phlebotomi TaxID=2605433 RepID=A0A5D4GSD8_9SPHI|nr:hypothetical protein [Sphingobacterium phlebotomi]TYR31278.1 hypothetical protein FXV77_20950 [Sphingobacterium phlebotomi]